MNKYLRLSCLNLYTGVIRYHEGHTFSCFFIVEHTDDKEYIKKHALELMTAGCRNSNFYGKQAKLWENIYASVDIYKNQNEYNCTAISTWDKIESFVDALRFELSARTLIPHDVYLIYDDDQIGEQVLSM